MIRYKNCKLYRAEDVEKKTCGVVDIESMSALYVYSSVEYDRFREDRQTTAYIPHTTFDLDRTGYNISVPDVGDFKITSFYKKQTNVGDFKKMYRYQLTIEG